MGEKSSQLLYCLQLNQPVLSAMRLTDFDMNAVGHGFVCRMPGIDPFEEVFDLMLVLLPEGKFGFVVSSGQKAGHTIVVLPDECFAPGTRMLSIPWLRANWNKWVMPEIAAFEVEVLQKYTVPKAVSFD